DSVRADPALLARLQATGAALTFCDPQTFAPRRAGADLCAHFRVDSLHAFGVGDLTAGLGAAAAALAYLRATQGDALGHLTRLQRLTAADAMALDETAVVTLELLVSSAGSVRESLFGVLDATVTPMGARLLRQWLLRPLLDPSAIGARQDAGGALGEAPAGRAKPSGLPRRTRRGAAGEARGAAATHGRRRASDEPRHSRAGARARSRRAARLSGAAAGHPEAGGDHRRAGDRRGRRRSGPARRPARAPDVGARGR